MADQFPDTLAVRWAVEESLLITLNDLFTNRQRLPSLSAPLLSNC